MKPSMKTTSNEVVDNVLDATSRNNATRLGFRMKTRRSIMKKPPQRSKRFFQHLIPPFLPDDNFEDVNKFSRKQLATCVALSMYENTVNNSENPDNSVDNTQDSTRLLPKTLVILYCKTCQSYSHSAKGNCWLKAPTKNHESPLLKPFLMNKIRCYCTLLRLILTDSWIISSNPHRISIALNLKFQASSGVWHEKSCIVDYNIANTICPYCSTNQNTVRSLISEVICPILKDDLVYLPPKVAANMGIQDMGPLVICIGPIGLISHVHFIDPLTLKQCRIKADAYWRDPFLSLKTSKELVEFIVHDVNIVLSRSLYDLAEVRVARVLDSGSYGTPVLVRTHLGRQLKPGSRALGYDLTDVEIENCKSMLPFVVLIKRCSFAMKLAHEFSRKKASPEYEQIVNDLEKKPEAVFNLSLNGGDAIAKEQNSEMSSKKPEDLGLDLGDLLADLNLSDQ